MPALFVGYLLGQFCIACFHILTVLLTNAVMLIWYLLRLFVEVMRGCWDRVQLYRHQAVPHSNVIVLRNYRRMNHGRRGK